MSSYIKLPCNAGDKVYILKMHKGKKIISRHSVKGFYIDNDGIHILCKKTGSARILRFHVCEIGEEIFLTPEEAKAVLEKD